MNLIDGIDGIDGLSSGLSMFALSGFAALFWQLGVESYTLVSLGLIGAVMAFFFFNVFGSERRGTKTFMGVTGSLVLGYTLAYLAIKYAMNNPVVLAPRPHGMTVVITLLAVPVFDLVRVACMRLLNRKGIFHPRQNARTPLGFGRGLLHDPIAAPHSWSATADYRRECRDVEF